MKTAVTLPDIKPQTAIASLDRTRFGSLDPEFPMASVAPALGMAPTFIRKIVGRKARLSAADVLLLLDQDSFKETFVPRSKVLDYLRSHLEACDVAAKTTSSGLLLGSVLDQLPQIATGSVQCIITSTPYWAMRIYKDSHFVRWADDEVCPYGHEQTPEGFARHTTEVLYALSRVLSQHGSIWWNVMDSFNTRTQIRGNAAEALRAMQGRDARSWGDHESRRYSAGHSYLKDGEQCLIPGMIAERASRIGLYVKSVITWAKTSTLPEPQESRVSRSLEYVLHLTKERTPYFDKSIYRALPASLGGRNNGSETDKLSDVWVLPTSSGRDGHGAQFPIALPARCIALSTRPGDLVLDPFVGSGNSGVAAKALGRKFVGIDVSPTYMALAEARIEAAVADIFDAGEVNPQSSPPLQTASLL